MKTLKHIFNAALLSASLVACVDAGEGATSSVSTTPSSNRNAVKTGNQLVGFSETTDLEVWLTTTGGTTSPHVYLEFVNHGVHFAYPRKYVLSLSRGSQRWTLFGQQTEVLAPNAWSSRTYPIPKQFLKTGAIAEVAFLESDDNPSNDYYWKLIPALSWGK